MLINGPIPIGVSGCLRCGGTRTVTIMVPGFGDKRRNWALMMRWPISPYRLARLSEDLKSLTKTRGIVDEKLINSAGTVLGESLAGFAAAHGDIVVRRSLQVCAASKPSPEAKCARSQVAAWATNRCMRDSLVKGCLMWPALARSPCRRPRSDDCGA